MHILANLRNSFSRLTYKDPARVELAADSDQQQPLIFNNIAALVRQETFNIHAKAMSVQCNWAYFASVLKSKSEFASLYKLTPEQIEIFDTNRIVANILGQKHADAHTIYKELVQKIGKEKISKSIL